MVWLLPALQLRHTKVGGDVAEKSMKATQGSNQRMQDSEVFLSVKQAESGDWIGLLRQCVSEMEADRWRESCVSLSAWKPAQQQRYKAVESRAGQGGILQARAALEGGQQVANDGRTLKQFEGLVAVQVDGAERHGLSQVIELAWRQKLDRIVIKKTVLRGRIWRLQRVSTLVPVDGAITSSGL